MPQPHRVRARRKKRAESRIRSIHQKKCREALLDLGAIPSPDLESKPSQAEMMASEYLCLWGASRMLCNISGNRFIAVPTHLCALAERKSRGRSFPESLPGRGDWLVPKRSWVEVASWIRSALRQEISE